MRFFHLGLAVEKQLCLDVMLSKFFRLAAHLVFVHRRRKRHESRGSRLKRATSGQGIRFVRNTAAMKCLAMHAVALIVLHSRDWRVDGDFMKVGSAEPSDLCIDIGVYASGQKRIVAKIYPRDNVRCAKRNLLGFREKIVWVAVEYHASDRDDWNEFFGNEFSGIENIEAELLTLLLRKGLNS